MLTDDEASVPLCFSAWSAHAARPCSRTPQSPSRARPPRCTGCCPARSAGFGFDALVAANLVRQMRAALRRPPRQAGAAHRRAGRRPAAEAARSPSPTATKRTGPPNGVLEPYGVVAHRGRWYAHGPRLAQRSGALLPPGPGRARAVVQEGQFSVPGGLDPATQVAEAVSSASWPARGLGPSPGQQSGWRRMRDARIDRHPSSRSTGNPDGCGCDGESSGSTGSRRSWLGSAVRSSSRSRTSCASGCARWQNSSHRGPKPADRQAHSVSNRRWLSATPHAAASASQVLIVGLRRLGGGLLPGYGIVRFPRVPVLPLPVC